MSNKDEKNLETNNEEKIKTTKKRHNRIWLGIGAALGVAIVSTGALYFKNYKNKETLGQLEYGVPQPSISYSITYYEGINKSLSEVKSLVASIMSYNMSEQAQIYGKINIIGTGISGTAEDGFKIDETVMKPSYFYKISIDSSDTNYYKTILVESSDTYTPN